jgi:hypothetical protein
VADQILGATSATKESPASDQPGKDVNRRLPELLEANRSFYTLAVLAWNVLQALKLLHLPETEAPKRMRTLLPHLLLFPVELKRHARSLKACLYEPAVA